MGNHVKIHSYANWACNPQDKEFSPFQHRMSVATIMYNYLGATVFPQMTSFWHKCGLTSDFHHILEVFEKGISHGVPNHAGIVELSPYSELARFIIPVRKHFHKTFKDHAAEFPGIDA